MFQQPLGHGRGDTALSQDRTEDLAQAAQSERGLLIGDKNLGKERASDLGVHGQQEIIPTTIPSTAESTSTMLTWYSR